MPLFQILTYSADTSEFWKCLRCKPLQIDYVTNIMKVLIDLIFALDKWHFQRQQWPTYISLGWTQYNWGKNLLKMLKILNEMPLNQVDSYLTKIWYPLPPISFLFSLQYLAIMIPGHRNLQYLTTGTGWPCWRTWWRRTAWTWAVVTRLPSCYRGKRYLSHGV